MRPHNGMRVIGSMLNGYNNCSVPSGGPTISTVVAIGFISCAPLLGAAYSRAADLINTEPGRSYLRNRQINGESLPTHGARTMRPPGR